MCSSRVHQFFRCSLCCSQFVCVCFAYLRVFSRCIALRATVVPIQMIWNASVTADVTVTSVTSLLHANHSVWSFKQMFSRHTSVELTGALTALNIPCIIEAWLCGKHFARASGVHRGWRVYNWKVKLCVQYKRTAISLYCTLCYWFFEVVLFYLKGNTNFPVRWLAQ